jgi:hypothetical protein
MQFVRKHYVTEWHKFRRVTMFLLFNI